MLKLSNQQLLLKKNCQSERMSVFVCVYDVPMCLCERHICLSRVCYSVVLQLLPSGKREHGSMPSDSCQILHNESRELFKALIWCSVDLLWLLWSERLSERFEYFVFVCFRSIAKCHTCFCLFISFCLIRLEMKLYHVMLLTIWIKKKSSRQTLCWLEKAFF